MSVKRFFSGVVACVDAFLVRFHTPFMQTNTGKRTAKVRTTLTKRVIEALEPTDTSWIARDDKLTGFGRQNIHQRQERPNTPIVNLLIILAIINEALCVQCRTRFCSGSIFSVSKRQADSIQLPRTLVDICRHSPPPHNHRVNVPSARDGGVTGITNPVVMNADKGAGNTERHALSSSAWRFATRILDQA